MANRKAVKDAPVIGRNGAAHPEQNREATLSTVTAVTKGGTEVEDAQAKWQDAMRIVKGDLPRWDLRCQSLIVDSQKKYKLKTMKANDLTEESEPDVLKRAKWHWLCELRLPVDKIQEAQLQARLIAEQKRKEETVSHCNVLCIHHDAGSSNCA
jgi:hypothetical protein